MQISIVAALSENGVIGVEGRLPWKLPEDLKRFRQLTLGKTVLMGRKTFESIGNPLKKRRNMVLTKRLPGPWSAGVELFSTWKEALRACAQEEIFVIGGAALYLHALPLAQKLYLTLIHRVIDGDTWFPAWDASLFSEISSEKGFDVQENLAYSFLILQRR
jgi:dihydrofolate reductase